MSSKQRSQNKTPQWFAFGIVVFISFLLCLTINFRSYSELSSEMEEFENLNKEVETIAAENLAIQEEIRNLKSDPKVIEREARKLGMGRPDEKIFVPTR